jgi:cytochrome c553
MARRRISAVTVGTVFVLAVTVAWATGDAAAGRDKATACSNCHGLDGNGRVPLAGKGADELLAQMQAYRRGKSGDAMMKEVLDQLSEQDLADLAAYYSSRSRR